MAELLALDMFQLFQADCLVENPDFTYKLYLGTLIPLLLPLAKQGSVRFAPALFFAGAFNLLGGIVWDVPMCVQPMKTIAAVALTEGLSQVQVSLAGMLVAGIVLALGLTRSILVINNVIPLSVVRGMQLGLGMSLMRRGVSLVVDNIGWLPASGADCRILGLLSFGAVLLLQRRPRALKRLLEPRALGRLPRTSR